MCISLNYEEIMSQDFLSYFFLAFTLAKSVIILSILSSAVRLLSIFKTYYRNDLKRSLLVEFP